MASVQGNSAYGGKFKAENKLFSRCSASRGLGTRQVHLSLDVVHLTSYLQDAVRMIRDILHLVWDAFLALNSI